MSSKQVILANLARTQVELIAAYNANPSKLALSRIESVRRETREAAQA